MLNKEIDDYLNSLFEKYDVEAEDKALVKTYVKRVDKSLEESLSLFKLLLLKLNAYMGQRKFDKFYDSFLEDEQVKEILKPAKKITFHKFDKDELKNKVIKAAVLKNILETSKGYDNFLCWSYLKECINALIYERTDYRPDIDGLVDLLSDMYFLAMEDTNKFQSHYKETIVESYDKGVLELTKINRDKLIKCTRDTLNKVKTYKNISVDEYVAVVNQSA